MHNFRCRADCIVRRVCKAALDSLPWLNLPWLETKQLSKLRARVIHVKKRPTCSCPGGLVQLHCFRTGLGRNVLAWSLPQPCMQPVDCHAWFIRLKARGLHPNPRDIQPCVIAIKAIAHVA
ncbi:hypothetical protein LHGZ1_1933 [Laribacter hongkongensis]|uniref:Uncharacterized protein n=1 Tax=Laribacter hongkongensis TaxID=168471 RepID=A0A248LJX8_9NEIS|nr:hypothetical protein LHGZ1_1933 [Laribacter hongkongensis]